VKAPGQPATVSPLLLHESEAIGPLPGAFTFPKRDVRCERIGLLLVKTGKLVGVQILIT